MWFWYRFVAVLVCGRFSLWPFWMYAQEITIDCCTGLLLWARQPKDNGRLLHCRRSAAVAPQHGRAAANAVLAMAVFRLSVSVSFKHFIETA